MKDPSPSALLNRAIEMKVGIKLLVGQQPNQFLVFDNYKIRDMRVTSERNIMISNVANSLQKVAARPIGLCIFDFYPSTSSFPNTGRRGDVAYIPVFPRKGLKIHTIDSTSAYLTIKRLPINIYASDRFGFLFGDIKDERLLSLLADPELFERSGVALQLLKNPASSPKAGGLDGLLDWVLEREDSLKKNRDREAQEISLRIFKLHKDVKHLTKVIEMDKVRVSGAAAFPLVTNEQLLQLKTATIDDGGVILPQLNLGFIPWEGLLTSEKGATSLSLDKYFREAGL